MSQIEVGKLTQYAVIGSPDDNAIVSKLVMFAILVPGDDGSAPETPDRQSYCYGQRVRRG